MDENIQARFDEKVKELLSAAKKKKNVLEYQEINEFFAFLHATIFKEDVLKQFNELFNTFTSLAYIKNVL